MKFGIRKPSLKKSLKARTTGKLKRSAKRALIPGYGKKGMGWIKNPKKAAYNKAYNKTSVSLFPAIPSFGKTKRKNIYNTVKEKTKTMKICKFCDTENQDSAIVCSSCGGNEFTQKTYSDTIVQSVKKNKIWLWVLGWIYIFPVPLTILMVRNKKLSKIAKIAIITIAWMFYLIMACACGTDDTETKTASIDNNVSSVVSSESVEDKEENKTVLEKESSSVDSSSKVKSSSSESVTSSKKTETSPESKVSSSKQQSTQKTVTSTTSSSSNTSKPATSSKSSSSSTSSKKTSSSSSTSNTSSNKTSSSTSSKASSSSENEVDFSKYKYVLNNNAMTIHSPFCSSIKRMKKGNAQGSNQSFDTLTSKGYKPCKNCQPF